MLNASHNKFLSLTAKRSGTLKNEAFGKMDKKTKAHLGQVETPIEIVDFINRSVAEIAKRNFGADLKDCTILDPFAGDGRFAARMYQTKLVPPESDAVESWEVNKDVAEYASEKTSEVLTKLAGKPVKYKVKVKDTF